MFKKQEINDHIFPRLKKESYLHRRKLRDYVLRFSENVLPEQKILDFGCGNKPYLRFFSTKSYFGIDGSLKSKADIIGVQQNIIGKGTKELDIDLFKANFPKILCHFCT